MYDEVLVPAGMGDVCNLHGNGPFMMMGPYGGLVTQRHPSETHLQRVHRLRRLRGQPDETGYVRHGAYHHITVMGKEDQPYDTNMT